MNSGHYYSITCCWENGNAFKFNDSADPEFVNNDDFDTEREEAYMLVFCKRTNEQNAVVNPTIYSRNEATTERTNVVINDADTSNNATEADSTNNASEADSTNDVSEPTTNIEKEMFKILKKNNILCIKVKDRNKTQTRHLNNLNYQFRKHPKIVDTLLNRFPQLKMD